MSSKPQKKKEEQKPKSKAYNYTKYRRKQFTESKVLVTRPKYQKRLSYSQSLEYMSPFGKTEPPSNNFSLGNFTTTNLLSRFTLTTSTTNNVIFVYNSGIRGIWQAACWESPTGAGTGTLIGGTHNQAPLYRFYNGSSETQPIAVKPLRSGVKLHNTTENQLVGGSVRCLQISSPLEWEFEGGASAGTATLTENFKNELLQMANQHPQSVEYTGQELSKQESIFVTAPCNASAYNSYGNDFYTAASSTADFETCVNLFARDMSMNIMVFVFAPTSSAQKYTITMGAQYAFRYPANTILGENAKKHKATMTDEQISDIHSVVQNHGAKKKPLVVLPVMAKQTYYSQPRLPIG